MVHAFTYMCMYICILIYVYLYVFLGLLSQSKSVNYFLSFLFSTNLFRNFEKNMYRCMYVRMCTLVYVCMYVYFGVDCGPVRWGWYACFPEADCGCGWTGQSEARQGAQQVTPHCRGNAGSSGGHPRDITRIHFETVLCLICFKFIRS